MSQEQAQVQTTTLGSCSTWRPPEATAHQDGPWIEPLPEANFLSARVLEVKSKQVKWDLHYIDHLLSSRFCPRTHQDNYSKEYPANISEGDLSRPQHHEHPEKCNPIASPMSKKHRIQKQRAVFLV